MRKQIDLQDKTIVLLQRKANATGISLKRFIERQLIAIALQEKTIENDQLNIEDVIKLDSRRKKKK